MLILLNMSKTKTLIGTTSIQATATLINILFLNSDLRKRYFTTENSLRLTSYILNSNQSVGNSRGVGASWNV